MTISAGTLLGRYEIVEQIGAGGMGEVWKARDTRLDRTVAIKTLPARFVADAQARLRFEREAKTISQLSHPHICTLYDVGDGYIVMELIEGESLAKRLARGPLPIQETLRIGSQIADALDRAHRAGVVHRDLKPGNVMLTKSGAKLLDFGLAKSDDPLAAFSPDGVTHHMPLTEAGMVSGTLQYMSPEQLEGLAVDGRTDIFALGALLYEMATGKPAFPPTSRTAVIAAIMTADPQPISQGLPLPASFDHVVRRCLAKDPDKRWRSAQDVAEELRWLAEGGSQPAISGQIATSTPPARGGKAKWLLAIASAAVIAAAVAWIAAVRWMRAHEDVSVYRLTVTTPPGSVLGYNAGSMALSPDGRQLAFASYGADGYTIVVRKLSEATWRTIDGTTGAHAPFWSADGKQIGFTARGSIWKVPVDGQVAPQEITRLPSARSPSSGTWNGEGTIVFDNAGKLYRVAASGGEPVALTLRDSARTPQFLPDGRHFIVTLFDRARGTLATAVGSLDPKEPTRHLTDGGNHASYSDGALLFERAGALYAQPFDLNRLALTGQPQPIAKIQALQDGAAYFSVAGGTLVYIGEGNEVRTELQRVDRNGKRVATIAGPAFFFSPRISHDGTRVAADQSAQNGLGDIWIFDAASGAATRATFDPDDESAPVWGPGDAEIVYFKTVASHDFLMRTRVTGGEPSVVFKPAGDAYPADWAPDGKSFVAMSTGGQSHVQITICSLPGWTATLTGITARGARLSPDGRWLAYAADEGSTSQVFVQSYPPRGNKWQVSLEGGTLPVWRRDGKALDFVSPTGTLMESLVSVAADGSFAAQAPQRLFGAALREGGLIFAQYDVFPDGTFLLNRIPETATTPMTVVIHWKEALAQ